MNSLPRLNRLFLWIALASAVPVALIVSMIIGQSKRDDAFEAKLRPSINFVESFLKSKYRLPKQKEFEKRPSAKTDWMVDLITKDSVDAAFKSNGGKEPNDYSVRIWRGETWTYYFSWKDNFDVVEP